MIEIRCPACDADLSRYPLGVRECPLCGEELHVTIDLREPNDIDARVPTVLIVDRDADFRKQIEHALEQNGFKVVAEVSNGPDAVLVSQRLRPAYVFLDPLLKAITVEEAARLIREVSPKSRIVALSAAAAETPGWADANLARDEVSGSAELLRSLVSETRS